MRVALLLTCLWPGLAQLWWRGQWLGLLAAVAFSVWLNLVLAAKFIWPELLTPLAAGLVYGLLGVFWIAGVCHSVITVFGRSGQSRQQMDGWFVQAQTEYLRGHWYEAESLLQRLLQRQPRDVECRLMLATLLRHTRRIAEAREQLREVERLEGAARWQVEIVREHALLKRVLSESGADPASDETPPRLERHDHRAADEAPPVSRAA